jgi:hypothetical protein
VKTTQRSPFWLVERQKVPFERVPNPTAACQTTCELTCRNKRFRRRCRRKEEVTGRLSGLMGLPNCCKPFRLDSFIGPIPRVARRTRNPGLDASDPFGIDVNVQTPSADVSRRTLLAAIRTPDPSAKRFFEVKKAPHSLANPDNPDPGQLTARSRPE